MGANKRDSKELIFLNVNDGSTQSGMQIVVQSTIENFEDIKKLSTGASVSVEGTVVASPGANQKYEIQANSIHIYGFSDPEIYPIQKKKMTLEYLRDIAHLRPRTNTYGAIFRIRHSAAIGIHQFFHEKGFYYIHTPIINCRRC